MSLIKEEERLDDLQFKNLFLIQNPKKYCFTSDAVALANFCKCERNGVIVDLCSGSGVVGILALKKTQAKKVILVEVQQELADMAERSVQYNKLEESVVVVNSALQNVYKKIGANFASTITVNPPYEENKQVKNESEEIAICRHEILVTLEDIIKESQKLLKFGGKFYMVHKAERLAEILSLLTKYGIEAKRLKFLKGKTVRVLVEAQKGAKKGLKIDFE